MITTCQLKTIQLPAGVLVLMSAALGTVAGAQLWDKVDISPAVRMLEGAYQFTSIKKTTYLSLGISLM